MPTNGTAARGAAYGSCTGICAVTDACRRLHIVAADVNELSPHYDPSGISTAAACKIVREMLIALGG